MCAGQWLRVHGVQHTATKADEPAITIDPGTPFSFVARMIGPTV